MAEAFRDHLSQAILAVSYTKSVMTIGAGNKFSDVIKSLGRSSICVTATRTVEIGTPTSPVASWIRSAAAIAEHVGCGNCGEHAAVAFVFLFNKNVIPIDYMSGGDSVDHAFVAIGRDANSDEADPKTWGESCVICDPWDNKTFIAADFRDQMYKGKHMVPTSVFRLNDSTKN